jgi:hypothetical protein
LNQITIIQEKPSADRISDLMRKLVDTAAQSESVAIGRILHICGMRGFAFLLLILSFLNIVIFMVPFLSFFLGLPMIILSAQMVMGLSAPIFPGVIRRRYIQRGPLIEGVTRAARWLDKIERYIKPRILVLSSPQLMRVHAFFALFMAVMVTLPIPVINVPPSIALAFLSLGILERDGIFILVGYTIGVWCLWLFASLGHLAL